MTEPITLQLAHLMLMWTLELDGGLKMIDVSFSKLTKRVIILLWFWLLSEFRENECSALNMCATYRQWMSSLMPFFPLWGTSGLLLSSFRLFFIVILSADWFLWDYRIHRSSSRKLCVFRITFFLITEKFGKLYKIVLFFLTNF